LKFEKKREEKKRKENRIFLVFLFSSSCSCSSFFDAKQNATDIVQQHYHDHYQQ